MDTFEVELIRIRTLSQSTRDFRFQVKRGEIQYLPGQFFRFTFQDQRGSFERSYSLCNFEADATPQDMDLVISVVEKGRASELLFNTDVGLTALAKGPYGRLTLPEPMPSRLFLVATSVGLAPYLPMLRTLANNNFAGTDVRLILGVRDRSEFLYGEWLASLASQFENFSIQLCLSRESAKFDYEYEGYVQKAVADIDLNPESDHFMLCGNPNMIDALYGYLKPAGFKAKQVVREKYVFAKDSAASEVPTKALSDEQKKLLAAKIQKYQK